VGVFQQQIQFTNLEIFVSDSKTSDCIFFALDVSFFISYLFALFCHIAASIRAGSVSG
jgi:hypothetical protein